MFEIQFSLYFLETLNPRLFRNFLAQIDDGMAHIMKEYRVVLEAALE